MAPVLHPLLTEEVLPIRTMLNLFNATANKIKKLCADAGRGARHSSLT